MLERERATVVQLLSRLEVSHDCAHRDVIRRIRKRMSQGPISEIDAVNAALDLHDVGALTEAEYLLRCNTRQTGSLTHQLHVKFFGSGIEEKFERSIRAFGEQVGVAPRSSDGSDNERLEYLNHVMKTEPRQLAKRIPDGIRDLLSRPCLVHFTFYDPRDVEAEIEWLKEVGAESNEGRCEPALTYVVARCEKGLWNARE